MDYVAFQIHHGMNSVSDLTSSMRMAPTRRAEIGLLQIEPFD